MAENLPEKRQNGIIEHTLIGNKKATTKGRQYIRQK